MSEVTYSFTTAYKCCKVNIERRSKFTTTMHSVEHTSVNDHAADYLKVLVRHRTTLDRVSDQHIFILESDVRVP